MRIDPTHLEVGINFLYEDVINILLSSGYTHKGKRVYVRSSGLPIGVDLWVKHVDAFPSISIENHIKSLSKFEVTDSIFIIDLNGYKLWLYNDADDIHSWPVPLISTGATPSGYSRIANYCFRMWGDR